MDISITLTSNVRGVHCAGTLDDICRSAGTVGKIVQVNDKDS